MMKPITDTRIEAAKKFNPKNLCKHLIKVDGDVVIVDKTKILKDVNDERLFIIIMNADYRWDYSDYQHSTIYFEADGNSIVGGVYNTSLRTKATRREIAVSTADGLTRQYVYNEATIAAMRERIESV